MASDTISSIPSLLRSCILKKVQLGSQIGKGNNSTILEGKWEGTVVAVKQIHIGHLTQQEQEITRSKFLMECDRSNRLRHANIVRFLGIYLPFEAQMPSVVMERLLCTLNNLLEQNNSVPLEMKASILHQVGSGIQYLHSRVPSIFRGNLTSKNILISKGMEAKISDFGTIRFFNYNFVPVFGASENQDFMAPEILANNPNINYGKESDIFSFGCIMLHTLSHQWPKPLPLEDNNIQSEKERRTQYFSSVPKDVENVIVPLIGSCLENLPFDRPTANEVCNCLEILADTIPHTLPDNLLQAQMMLHNVKCQLESQANVIRNKEAEIQSLRSMPYNAASHKMVGFKICIY